MGAIGNDTALLAQQEISNAVSRDTGTAADVKDITEHPEPEQEEETKAEDEDGEEENGVEEEKEIEPEQEPEPETEPVAKEEETEPGRFICRDSPDHYFSSRRDKEALEGIMSEGLSSEYNSPRHEPMKEGEYGKVVVEEKNATGLEKAEELREKENDSAPDERRDEEAPEGIVSKGLSSAYNSPRHEPVKEGEYGKVVVEEKNATGLEKAEELREKDNDSARDEEVVPHLAAGEVLKSN